MKTNITQELLKSIYDRAREVCIAKHDIDPYPIVIDDDGVVICKHTPSYYDADEESFYLSENDLNIENIDKLVEDRKEKERLALEQRERQAELDRQDKISRDKENRRKEYEKLRKEFE